MKSLLKGYKNQQFLTALLIIIALILGYAIFKQSNDKQATLIPSPSSYLAAKSNPSSASSSAKQRRELPANLSDDEKALLNPPAPDAPKEEKDKHFALVVKLAQEAPALELNQCSKPQPIDLKLKQNQPFQVNNSDTADHTIVIDQNHHYLIPAKGSIKITPDFGHGLGAYGYLCDDLAGVVGFFLVTP